MKNVKIKNDILLIIAVLLVASVLFLVLYLNRTEGAYAAVVINGKDTARYSLSENITVPIYTDGDSKYNVLVIQNGEASISEASCPDKICAHHKPVKYSGETIVCLPNKLVIRIDSPQKGIDAVS